MKDADERISPELLDAWADAPDLEGMMPSPQRVQAAARELRKLRAILAPMYEALAVAARAAEERKHQHRQDEPTAVEAAAVAATLDERAERAEPEEPTVFFQSGRYRLVQNHHGDRLEVRDGDGTWRWTTWSPGCFMEALVAFARDADFFMREVTDLQGRLAEAERRLAERARWDREVDKRLRDRIVKVVDEGLLPPGAGVTAP